MRTLPDVKEETAIAPAPMPPRSALSRVAERVVRATGDRRIMAGVTVLALVIYLWHSLQAIDYPWYDEAYYFYRALRLTAGDFATAGVRGMGASPLYIVYYAGWYTLLHTWRLFPLMFATGMLLLGMGCYLLLSRFLHPALAWGLALFTVFAAAPVVPQNGLYYTGAGLLWMSLSLLGKRAISRGLAALCVLATAYMRPDFLGVALLLLALLAVYEWRQIRALPARDVQIRRASRVALWYLPVVCGLLLTLVGALHAADSAQRVDGAIPWSYNAYLSVNDPQVFQGMNSLAQPFTLFEHDFGPVEPQTLPNTLLAMARHPDKTAPYLNWELGRLSGAFSAATFTAWGYQYSTTQQPPFWDALVNGNLTRLFWLGVVEFALLAWACRFALKRRGLYERLPLRRDTPALLGILSLSALVPWLVLINPEQRFWMTYPLVLLPFGIGVTAIAGWLVLRLPAHLRPLPVRWAPVAGVLLMLLFLPHPWMVNVARPHEATITFIRQHVPQHSTITGAPLLSYTYYLAGEGYQLDALEATSFQPSPLVQVEQYDPHLRYVLLTDLFPRSVYDGWFADWHRAYPTRTWKLVAQQASPWLRLYELQDSSNSPPGTSSTSANSSP